MGKPGGRVNIIELAGFRRAGTRYRPRRRLLPTSRRLSSPRHRARPGLPLCCRESHASDIRPGACWLKHHRPGPKCRKVTVGRCSSNRFRHSNPVPTRSVEPDSKSLLRITDNKYRGQYCTRTDTRRHTTGPKTGRHAQRSDAHGRNGISCGHRSYERREHR
jgi:hypothetical protein